MFYANGGMNTDYHATTFGNTPTGVDLQQLFLGPTYARRISSNHALGATAVLGWQRFSAKGLAAFAAMSSDPANLSNNGYANAVGAGMRVGYQGRVAPWMSVGAAYQSRVWMSKFGPYAGLFCQGGDFDIPSNWTAGVAVSPTRNWDVAADLQRTYYSDVHSVAHTMLPHLMMAPLGAAGSAGFGWKDITTVKLGAQVRTGDTWTWRGGYSFGDQPVRSSEVLFNILAPAVIEQHATLGFTRMLDVNRSMSVALTRAFTHKVVGPNVLEAPGQQNIALRMDEWEMEVGYSWGAR
jgi:long-chain fatty acid transport protein